MYVSACVCVCVCGGVFPLHLFISHISDPFQVKKMAVKDRGFSLDHVKKDGGVVLFRLYTCITDREI